ncbi:MAG: poly(3-hydroxybutyrate) depolymerase [Bacteroidetes bacterium]|nr:poly(3-hydroxybutyrate) depolymerase [Bacteroidota bacterium]
MKYFFAFLFIASCTVVQAQLVTDSVLIEQHYRTFSYYTPQTDLHDGSLMFIMHGSGGNNSNMYPHTKNLEAMAAKEKLLVVYPNGYKHYWNECRKYSNADANKEDINEQAFFKAMIAYCKNKFGISTRKVFAAGLSGGGHMAYKLGATMPGTIKGIAAVVANFPDSASCDCKLSNKPEAVLIINGTDDKTNPYNGGEMFVNNASFGVVLSTEKTFQYWSHLAGYTGAPGKTVLPDTDPNDKKTIEAYAYHAKNKPPVTLLKVIGGHHDYPNDIDVYVYVWNFFKSIK